MNVENERGRHGVEYDESGLLTLLAIPLRRWKAIAGIVIVTVGLAGVWVFAQPRQYVAEISMLPPQTEQRNPYLTDIAAGLPFGLGASLDESSEQPRMITILRSRSVIDSVVSWADLAERYEGIERPREAAEFLSENTVIEGKKDGSIVIRVTDTDPDRAAEVANTYPEALNSINYRMSSETALQRLEYLESQLARAATQLEDVEQSLVEFRKQMPAVEEQASQTLRAAAEIQRQIIEKELEIYRLRRVATPENPTLQRNLAELGDLRRTLRDLTAGRQEGTEPDVFLSFSEAPQYGITYARLMREFEKSQQIWATLTSGIAKTQIEAGDDVPIINVLDNAIAPSSPVAPNRRRTIQLASIASLFLGLAFAFVIEYAERARENKTNREFFEAWDGFKSDVKEQVWRPLASRLPGRDRHT